MVNSNELRGTLLKNEPLAKYTTWRVGGPAQQMYIPEDKEDLIKFIRFLPKGEQLFWIGFGSNLLIRDGGIKGTVINTGNRLKKMQLIDAERVYVEAGAPCAHVARFCSDLGLVNAEFFAGIPGTIGGALKMNAGAFGHETWNIVEKVEIINEHGAVVERQKQSFEVNYRSVKGLSNEWFLSAQLKLCRGDAKTSQQHIKDLLEKRNTTQPTNKPTCGSVFKNPPGDYAARLIEASGLKGYQIGNAIVSEKHANFIINLGKASAVDIERLIEHIQCQVQKQFGIYLETEVCRVGENE
jgi:UDP-N-acetylmuramate dehydrogenase